jgi:hypothetical protein
MKTINVAMIGQGFMGRSHSNAWGQIAKFLKCPIKSVMHASFGHAGEDLAKVTHWIGTFGAVGTCLFKNVGGTVYGQSPPVSPRTLRRKKESTRVAARRSVENPRRNVSKPLSDAHPQQGFLVRLFIASPSDVAEEREAAVRVVTDWNAAHSLRRKALIEAVRMETHAQAALGDHPQTIINRQLLDRCNLLIAIFWSRLGSPTPKAASGTVHEIMEFAKRKGPENVLLYFSQKDYPNSVDPDELKRVKEFQKRMQIEGLYIAFADVRDFAAEFRQQLEMRMDDLLIAEGA